MKYQDVIEVLEKEIEARREAVAALLTLVATGQESNGEVTREEVEDEERQKSQSPKSKSQEKPKDKIPKGRRKGSGGKVHPETMRIAERVAGMVEPFTAKQIGAWAKVDWKKASNFVTQGKVKGWLKGTGKAEYVRTLKFPVDKLGDVLSAAVPLRTAAPPLHPGWAGSGKEVKGRTRGIVEAELKKACEERDEQRAASRTTMEAIAQKRVDRLEEELEGMGS